MTKSFKPKIVSANDLFDGDVVYLDGDNNWTHRLGEAAVATSAAAADARLAQSDRPARGIGPSLLDVTLDVGGIQPDHVRERIRETGPTFNAEPLRHEQAATVNVNATTQGTM